MSFLQYCRTPQCRSGFWMILWAFSFSTSMVINRHVGAQATIFVLIGLRTFFGLISVLPFVLKNPLSHLRSQRPWWHVARGTLTFVAMICTYKGYQLLPMATAGALGMSGPLFTNLLSVFLLKERIHWQRWLMLSVGYAGVLLIIHPESTVWTPALLLPLLGNCAGSLSLLLLKKLSHNHSDATLLFFSALVPFLWSVGGGVAMQEWPSMALLWPFLMMGALGSFSQFCSLRAVRLTSPSFSSSFEYVRMGIFVPFGYIFFHEIPSVRTVMGLLLVVVSTLLLTLYGKFSAVDATKRA